MPYVDVIRMDPEHVVPKQQQAKWQALLKCFAESKVQVELEFNYAAMLGQLLRFYAPFVAAFFVAILQLYDVLMLLLIESRDELYTPRLMLNYFHANYLAHLVYSYLLALVTYLLPYFGNDYELLKTERTDNFLLAFILYWTAYALLNAVSAFSTFNQALISFIVNRIVLPTVSCLNFSLARKLGFFLHFVVTCIACFFSSALTHCILFYTIVIQLAANNPSYLRQPHDYIRFDFG